MQDNMITSKELRSKNLVVLPQKAKGFSDHTFWYYTSLKTADLVLKNKCIHISNLAVMNDVDEAKLHEDEKDFVHCLCLCNSNTEKIPMWYLYSGISGQGVSLGFTPAVMLELIGSIDTVSTTDGKGILHKGSDFEMDCGWVFYRKKEATSQVMYKRKWYSIEDPEEFERGNYFIKSYPWEYEKEFRVVIRNKTGVPHNKLVIDIGSVIDKIKMKLAPELSEEVFKELLPSFSGLSSIPSNLSAHSKLSINMKLCERNLDGFIDYLQANANKGKSNEVIDYSKICEAISSNCKHKGVV